MLLPVHPHIRGAYDQQFICIGFHGGSSPHTWGIHAAGRVGSRPARFIPTYVGHTDAHDPLGTVEDGSSPHTWGIRSIYLFNYLFVPVHPHIRGAYAAPIRTPTLLTGSSPHTWGILLAKSLLTVPRRFIPTYVGHTWLPAGGEDMLAVHPHIRGAYGRRPVGAKRRPVHPHIRGAYKSNRSPCLT